LFEFFFYSLLSCFPQTNVLHFTENANFLENEKKIVNVKDDTQKKSFFDDTARRRRSYQRSRVLREEPRRGGSRAFARVRIYR